MKVLRGASKLQATLKAIAAVEVFLSVIVVVETVLLIFLSYAWVNDVVKVRERVLSLEFDRVRVEDISNIILAVQDFQYENGFFPDTLEQLKQSGFMSVAQRLNDPATDEPYYYRSRGRDFVLCAQLSDMMKGVNTAECSPDRKRSAEAEAAKPKPVEKAVAAKPTQKKLEMAGRSSMNVREEPSTDALVIAKVQPGDVFVYTETRDGWYRITLPDNEQGWVNSALVNVIE